MVAPQLWHENANSPYLRPESCDFDKLQWEVRDSAGKTSIWIPGGGALVFTAKALLLGPPSRWNDDPRQALTVRLQGDQLTTWLRDIEDWALPKIVSREEAKSHREDERVPRDLRTRETEQRDALLQQKQRADGTMSRSGRGDVSAVSVRLSHERPQGAVFAGARDSGLK